MKSMKNFGTLLSRSQQKAITGGSFTCSICYNIGIMTVCPAIAYICPTLSACNAGLQQYCAGRPGCFWTCSEGGGLDL